MQLRKCTYDLFMNLNIGLTRCGVSKVTPPEAPLLQKCYFHHWVDKETALLEVIETGRLVKVNYDCIAFENLEIPVQSTG
jgi:hypothetical protein